MGEILVIESTVNINSGYISQAHDILRQTYHNMGKMGINRMPETIQVRVGVRVPHFDILTSFNTAINPIFTLVCLK